MDTFDNMYSFSRAWLLCPMSVTNGDKKRRGEQQSVVGNLRHAALQSLQLARDHCLAYLSARDSGLGLEFDWLGFGLPLCMCAGIFRCFFFCLHSILIIWRSDVGILKEVEMAEGS